MNHTDVSGVDFGPFGAVGDDRVESLDFRRRKLRSGA